MKRKFHKYHTKKSSGFRYRLHRAWQRLFGQKQTPSSFLPRTPTEKRYRWRKRILFVFAAFALMGCSFLLGFFFWIKQSGILDIDESRLKIIVDYQHADNSLVFDRNGQKIGEFFSDYHVFIPIEKIPPKLIDAVLAIEDRHFFEHPGIDLRGIGRAMFSFLRTGSFSQGGSTLTQQLVRNFLLSPEKTVERKIKEAILSLQLEKQMSKKKILELYLNALFLGQGAYGVGAAAERHFGKPLDQLQLHELAVIAGLFQSPSRYNPHKSPEQARRRQIQVLKAMLHAKRISKEEFKEARKKKLVYHSQLSVNTTFAPHFIDAVQEQTEKLLGTELKGKGLRIYTTLDLELQKQVNNIISNSNDIFQKASQRLVGSKTTDPALIEAATLTINQHTGEILALTGGRNFEHSQFNRAFKAKRAPGSAFKPIVYAQALLSGMQWSDLIYVSPVTIQDYRPQNYSNKYLTESTLYQALYQSLNTPVVEIGYHLGIKNILNLAQRMGVHSELKNQAGTLLGGSELTLLDMAAVYATIANYGVQKEPYFIQRITDRTGTTLYERPHKNLPEARVMPEPLAYLLIDGLQSVFRHGTANSYASWGQYAGGKTGTTNEAKDNWFCGFTSSLTTVVWVGTDENFSFEDSVAASTLALPLWIRINEMAKKAYPLQEFKQPDGVIKVPTNPSFGFRQEGGLDIPYLIGREPQRRSSSLTIVRETGNYRDDIDQ